MSFVLVEDGGKTKQLLFKEVIDEMKGEIIGERIWKEHKRWPMYSKFFDNMGALPHHIHQRDEDVVPLGLLGKPEAYYFPPQVNNHGGDFPFTFFGFNPGVTKDQVRETLKNFTKGDNKITNLSRSYRLETSTGWDVPPGILHAPGSMCTYEPQRASDVFSMFQSLVNDQLLSEDLLWRDAPKNKVGNYDHLVDLIDWELNVDPKFQEHRFMKPKPVADPKDMNAQGYHENWIVYKSTYFSAKELTVFPGSTVTIKDGAAYGMIMMQGHGTMGTWDIETPALIRYGQLTYDEFFITEKVAAEGVRITNPSKCDPIVMLKHFGPSNPDLVL